MSEPTLRKLIGQSFGAAEASGYRLGLRGSIDHDTATAASDLRTAALTAADALEARASAAEARVRVLEAADPARAWEADHQRDALEQLDAEFGTTLAVEFPFGCDTTEHVAEALIDARADNAALRAFATRIIDQMQMEVEGVQDIAVECGLLAPVVVTEPCGEACPCTDYGFPTECFRRTVRRAS